MVFRSPKDSQVKFHNGLGTYYTSNKYWWRFAKAERLSEYPVPHEIQCKERSYSQEKGKYCKNLSEFMRADWESWKSLPELSSHCWFINVGRTHAINPKPFSAPTPTKDLSLDRAEEFTCHGQAWLEPRHYVFFYFPICTENLPLGGFPQIVS